MNDYEELFDKLIELFEEYARLREEFFKHPFNAMGYSSDIYLPDEIILLKKEYDDLLSKMMWEKINIINTLKEERLCFPINKENI